MSMVNTNEASHNVLALLALALPLSNNRDALALDCPPPSTQTLGRMS